MWAASYVQTVQGVPKVREKKKIQYLHRSFIKWAHLFLGDRGYFEVFFHKKTFNRYFFEPSVLTSISKCTHFWFVNKYFRERVPEMIKAFEPIWWSETFEAIFFSLLEDHWTITTFKRFMLLCSFGWDMEFLVDYLLDDPNFSKKIIVSNFDLKLWPKGGLTQTSFCAKFQNFWI